MAELHFIRPLRTWYLFHWSGNFLILFGYFTALLQQLRYNVASIENWIIVCSLVTSLQSEWLENRGSISSGDRDFCSPPPHAFRTWSPPRLLFNGDQSIFLGGKAAGLWSWILISISDICRRLRQKGTTFPLLT